MTDSHTHDIAKAKAEATFRRKEEQAREGAIAMAEYRAEQASVRARTEKLRAERLARESKAAQNPAEPPAKKKKTARRG